MPSVFQQPNVTDAALEKEYKAGHIFGPFQAPPRIFTLLARKDGWQVI